MGIRNRWVITQLTQYFIERLGGNMARWHAYIFQFWARNSHQLSLKLVSGKGIGQAHKQGFWSFEANYLSTL
jgi:hypothetical protein